MKNNRKNESVESLRQQAHDWKKRAKSAEARLVELLREKVRTQDEHRAAIEEMAKMIDESDRELASVQADLKNEIDDRAELEYELVQVKAHAYDLAFGSPVEAGS